MAREGGERGMQFRGKALASGASGAIGGFIGASIAAAGDLHWSVTGLLAGLLALAGFAIWMRVGPND